MSSSAKSVCPKCRSTNIARVVYGMPDCTEWLEKRLGSGSIILGGCCVSGEDPDKHCNDCGTEWWSRGVLKNGLPTVDGKVQITDASAAICSVDTRLSE